MNRLVRLLPLAIALVAAGCSAVPEAAAPDVTESTELMGRLASLHVPEAFSAEGSITVITPTMEQSAGFEMIARGDDSVKMSIFGPFGITVGAALFTREQFTAYNALNNTVYTGSPERQLRSLPFVNAIPFEFFMGTLQGMHILSSAAQHGIIRADGAGRFSFTAVNADSSIDSLRYDGVFGRIVSCRRFDAAGTEQWSIRYRYTRTDTGLVIPQQVELSVPFRSTTLIIDYDAVTQSAEAAAFTLPYPDDAEIITVQ